MSTRADFPVDGEPPQHYGLEAALNYYWDVPTLEWVKGTQPGGGGGGGDATAANQVTGNASLSSIDGKVLTDAQLRASAVPVSGTFFQATQPVSGTFFQATQPVSGPLTDAQLRAVAVPVSGTVTTGGLTDAQLRATPVPVSGTVTATGPLTDAQLRATPVPVSGTVAGTQSGTWTVQPGNTPNTTPWLVSSKVDLTPSAPAAATVGVASAQAVAANASRKGLALVNVSNARISLGLGATAVLDSGITLYPGGSFEMDQFTFDVGAVNAIASAAASPLAVQEFA